VLSAMQKVEESEQGALFMGKDGDVRFVGRHELLSSTSQGRFGDGGPYAETVALRLPGTAENYVSTPDSAANSVTGDIDVRVKVAMDDWTPGTENVLVSHAAGAPGWKFAIRTPGGQLGYTHFGVADWTATTGTGFTDGTVHWVRVTRNVTTGDVKFYLSEDGATWTQNGATVTSAAAATPDSTAPLMIGQSGSASQWLAGNVYYAEIRNGIDGPVVAKFDATEVAVTGTRTPATTTQDGTVWTVNGSAWDWVTLEELEYADLVYVYDDQLIFNEVQATREGGVTQVVGDQASQSRYMRRTKVFDGLLYASDAEARGLGDWWVHHYKEPLLRATNMRLEPSVGNADTHFPHVLGRELMDRVTVRRRPQNYGAAIDQETLIEGMTHDVTPDEWITTWNLSPAEAQVYWLAQVVGHSEAEISTVAGF